MWEKLSGAWHNILSRDQTTTEAIPPVSLKFCIDHELLESVLDFDFIDGESNHVSLTNYVLNAYPDKSF